MLNKLSSYISKEMYSQKLIDSNEVDICIYCLSCFFSYCIFILYIISVCFIANNFSHSIYYIMVLFIGRIICGGAHFNSKTICNIFSFMCIPICTFTTDYFTNINIYIFIMMSFFCLLLLFIICPVQHPNKQFTTANLATLKKSKNYYIVMCCISIKCLLYYNKTAELICISQCLFILTISCIIGKHLYRKPNNHNPKE